MLNAEFRVVTKTSDYLSLLNVHNHVPSTTTVLLPRRVFWIYFKSYCLDPLFSKLLKPGKIKSLKINSSLMFFENMVKLV